MLEKIRGYVTGTRLVVYGGLLVLIVVVLHSIAPELPSGWFDQQSIEALIVQSGNYSYILYVLFVFVMTLTPVASSALWLVGGYLFNPWLAVFLTVLAEVLGAFGNYYIGRKVIGGYVERGKFPRVSALIATYHGRLTMPMVFLLGLMPVSTTNVTGYAAGLTSMPLWKYVTAWGGGVLVLSFITIHLGQSAAAHAPVRSVVLVVVMTLVIVLALRLLKRKVAAVE